MPQRQPSMAPGKGERLFAILVLLLASGAFMNLIGNDESTLDKGIGSVIMQGIWSVIYLATLFLLQRRCKGFLGALREEKLLFILVALTTVSVCWSDEPAFTFRRSVALMGTTLFGIYFARRFCLADQIRILSRVFGVVVILSLFFVAVLPHYGIANADFGYAWQGVYGHKNNLGAAMALGVVVFIFRAILDRRESLKWWVAVGFGLALLLMAHSSTGFVACLLALSVFVISPALRWSPRRAIPFFLGVGVIAGGAALWALNNLTYVLSLIGRDPSFTSRTTIWMVSIVMITQHPWLGYGYNEFWPGTGTDIVARFTHGFQASHAHNAILNLWLDVGLLGVVVFVLQYVKSLWAAVVAVRHTRAVEWLWPLIFLFFIAAYGLDESVILQRNGLSWILFTAVVLQISSFRVPQAAVSQLLAGKRAAVQHSGHGGAIAGIRGPGLGYTR
jgi:exopolysaccharide production protein ExoQ